MKKVLLSVLSAAVVFSMCMATAFAAASGCGRYFTDADGDGICDRAGSGSACVDADEDGLCDVCGVAHVQFCGGNFVDEDADGICDNYASGQGIGRGRGCHGGRGNGFLGGCGR